MEIKISCPNDNCVHNGPDGTCTREELFLKVVSKEFRGRGEPDYRLRVLTTDLSQCFKSKDGTNVLGVEKEGRWTHLL